MKVKGNLIREARRRKEFSQDYMAHLLDISQSQYSKLENGEANFDVSKLGVLLDELELNPLEVIEFSEKQQIFINSNNTIVNNAGEIKSPLISNDEILFAKLFKKNYKNSRNKNCLPQDKRCVNLFFVDFITLIINPKLLLL